MLCVQNLFPLGLSQILLGVSYICGLMQKFLTNKGL